RNFLRLDTARHRATGLPARAPLRDSADLRLAQTRGKAEAAGPHLRLPDGGPLAFRHRDRHGRQQSLADLARLLEPVLRSVPGRAHPVVAAYRCGLRGPKPAVAMRRLPTTVHPLSTENFRGGAGETIREASRP